MFDAVGSPPGAAALDDKAAGSRAASLGRKLVRIRLRSAVVVGGGPGEQNLGLRRRRLGEL
jgi:hypothetical protein